MNKIVKYWLVVSIILFAAYLLIPKTAYAMEGEYCCPPDAEECLLIMAPCDIRHGWIGGAIVANLIISIAASVLEKLERKNE